MAIDMRHPHSPVRWLLRPHDRDTLVETYQLAETIVHDETTTRHVLERAFRHYTMLTVDLSILCEHEGRALVERVEQAEAPVIRASLHRLNCQLLRIISSMTPCPHGCCCHCKAAYPDIACTYTVNQSPGSCCGDEESSDDN